jgi:hypothetical protein
MNYKLSLHSHLPNFKNPNNKLIIEFLEILFKKPSVLVLGISNSNNNGRYKKFLDSIQFLPSNYKIDKSFKDYFFSITKDRKTIYFIKTDEIGTEKGHILVIGFNGNFNHKKLNESLIEAHKQNCIVIANHPLHEFKVPHFIINDVLGVKKKISMTKRIIKKYKKDFDALELNSYFPEDWKEIKKFAKRNNLSIVSDSDAHFINEIFTSYYSTEKLNFSSPEDFKHSLKKALKNGIKLHAKAFGFEAKYKHGFQIFLHRLGIRL